MEHSLSVQFSDYLLREVLVPYSIPSMPTEVVKEEQVSGRHCSPNPFLKSETLDILVIGRVRGRSNKQKFCERFFDFALFWK